MRERLGGSLALPTRDGTEIANWKRHQTVRFRVYRVTGLTEFILLALPSSMHSWTSKIEFCKPDPAPKP